MRDIESSLGARVSDIHIADDEHLDRRTVRLQIVTRSMEGLDELAHRMRTRGEVHAVCWSTRR